MKHKYLFLALAIFSLSLTTWHSVMGQEPQPKAVEVAVASSFTYQGFLSNLGSPANGEYDFKFSLWDAPTGGRDLSPVAEKLRVPVAEGVFTVELAFAQTIFNGQALYLQIEVRPSGGGTYTSFLARPPLTSAPYALSLRPGAIINGDSTALTVASKTIAQEAALMGYASAASGPNRGLIGRTNSVQGAGVYALGKDTGADLILGGEASTASGDDGRLASDPTYSSSDLWLQSNDDIVLELDDDGDGDPAHVMVYDKDDNTVFDIDRNGAVSINKDAGSAAGISIGQRYRDNGIVAWARVSAAGALGTNSFGVQSVSALGPGIYSIDLTASASSGLTLIPMAVAEVEAAPAGAANVRLVAVDQVSADVFNVYINNGNFNLVSNDFVFMVTGR